MKKFILFSILCSFLIAQSKLELVTTYEYERPYVDEVIEYDDYEDVEVEEEVIEYVEEEIPVRPLKTLRRKQPVYTEVVYERPVVREVYYDNNPAANFFSGLVGFTLGSIFTAAISDN